MKRVDWIVLGVFLTLLVQSHFGLFDSFYDALLVALATQDQGAIERALYQLLGQTQLVAELRGENPIGFFVLNGVFCAVAAELFSIPVRILAYCWGSLTAAAAITPDDLSESPKILPAPASD